MILKDRVLEEIEKLSPGDLIAVQNLVLALKARKPYPPKVSAGVGCAKARLALAAYPGNLSDTIIEDREERL